MKWIKDYDFHFLNSDKLDSSGQYTKEFQGRLYPEHIKFIKDLLDKQKQEFLEMIGEDDKPDNQGTSKQSRAFNKGVVTSVNEFKKQLREKLTNT